MKDGSVVEHANDENFQEQIIESPVPAIVVFEKNYWGTTHIMKPILEQLASEYASVVKIFKYNLDDNSTISEHYKIGNATTVLLFNKGKVVYKTGFISKGEFRKIVDSCLNNTLEPLG